MLVSIFINFMFSYIFLIYINYFCIIYFFLIIYSILIIGHDFKKSGPLKGCRKAIITFLYRFNATLFVATAGLFTKKICEDYDYTYYLGPNYK
jgi:hypothetical protein